MSIRYNGNPTTTVPAVCAAIERSLREALGDRIRQYGTFQPTDAMHGTPEPDIVASTLLIEVEGQEFERESDPHGRLAVRLDLAAVVILSVQQPNLQMALCELTSRIAAILYPRRSAEAPRAANTWGLLGAIDPPIAPAREQPGRFAGGGLNGRDSRVIRWSQVAYLDEGIAE